MLRVCYGLRTRVERGAIQTNGDDNFAAAIIVKFFLAKTDIPYINPFIRLF